MVIALITLYYSTNKVQTWWEIPQMGQCDRTFLTIYRICMSTTGLMSLLNINHTMWNIFISQADKFYNHVILLHLRSLLHNYFRCLIFRQGYFFPLDRLSVLKKIYIKTFQQPHHLDNVNFLLKWLIQRSRWMRLFVFTALKGIECSVLHGEALSALEDEPRQRYMINSRLYAVSMSNVSEICQE